MKASKNGYSKKSISVEIQTVGIGVLAVFYFSIWF